MIDDSYERAEEEYWDAFADDYRVYSTVTLPDGRKVEARCDIDLEYYYIPESLQLEWENGEELTEEEFNIKIEDSYLHEWVLDHM